MITSTVVLLLIGLIYASVMDLKYRRIPNRLTFPILLGGIILHTLSNGRDGLLTSFTGAGLALAIMIAPFALYWVGAGDVKLAMAVGALMGPNFVMTALLFAAVFAGVIALADILRKRQLLLTARYLAAAWHMPAPKGLALKAKLPYAPAIACGSVIALLPVALSILG